MTEEAEQFVERFIRCKSITKEEALKQLIVRIIIKEFYDPTISLGGSYEHNE